MAQGLVLHSTKRHESSPIVNKKALIAYKPRYLQRRSVQAGEETTKSAHAHSGGGLLRARINLLGRRLHVSVYNASKEDEEHVGVSVSGESASDLRGETEAGMSPRA